MPSVGREPEDAKLGGSMHDNVRIEMGGGPSTVFAKSPVELVGLCTAVVTHVLQPDWLKGFFQL